MSQQSQSNRKFLRRLTQALGKHKGRVSPAVKRGMSLHSKTVHEALYNMMEHHKPWRR